MKGCGRLAMLAAALCLWGCASSERMCRMSGGVFQKYSEPRDQRIRSEKFRKYAAQLAKPGENLIGEVEETPVNIWPFFFASEYYTSILWPCIDWDPYGFAVRPFYNQEGDERSVLFPLTAWNTLDREGWVLLYIWDKPGWIFFPFAAHRETPEKLLRYYTPFFIQKRDRRPLDEGTRSRSDFTEAFLVYSETERTLNIEGWKDLFYADELDERTQRFLAYKLAGTERPLPKNDEELKALRKEIAATLPVKEEKSLGFIPLFHANWDDETYLWRAPAYLAGASLNRCGTFSWDVLGRLLYYEREAPLSPWVESRTSSGELCMLGVLLSGFSKTQTIADEGTAEAIAELRGFEYGPEDGFRNQRPQIRAALKRIDPSLELPDTVTSRAALSQYLAGISQDPRYKDVPFNVYTRRSGGCLPLFLYEFDDTPDAESYWFSLAVITRYAWKQTGWNFLCLPLLSYADHDAEGGGEFWSIPLLSFAKHSKRSEHLYIAPPLIWHSTTERRPSVEAPILPADTRWAENGEYVSEHNAFTLCGLFYQSDMSYRTVKPGLDAEAAENIRRNLPMMFEAHENALAGRQSLRSACRERELLQPSNDEEESLRRQLEIAALRRNIKAIEKDEEERFAAYAAMREDAKKLGFELEPAFPRTQKQGDQALKRLIEAATELRSQEDEGSLFFYREERCYNGDFKWHFCHILAGGEKEGDREQKHVLQYLYRYRRDGKRVEKLCFPFISIREDEQSSRVSFMGRVWQRTIRDGKKSGYLFFIPYGGD